jgi:hypothetical protein
MTIIFREYFTLVFRIFTRFAAGLLHRRLGLHTHKVRDDRYSTNSLEAIYLSFVLGASLLKKSPSARSADQKSIQHCQTKTKTLKRVFESLIRAPKEH